jgi:hypothetical protein
MQFKSDEKSLLTVEAGGDLTLKDITLKSDRMQAADIGLITVGGIGAKLTFESGVSILNLKNNGGKGSGVWIKKDGVFIMNKGIISGNESLAYGTGVYNSGGTFVMNGGTIAGNTVYYAHGGGGVLMKGGSAFFTMNGGTIHGNEANGGGGGVGIWYGGTFAPTDGIVYGNTPDNFAAIPW